MFMRKINGLCRTFASEESAVKLWKKMGNLLYFKFSL